METGSTSFTLHGELLSSLDIQEWNRKMFFGEVFDNIGQVLSLARLQMAVLDPEKKEEARKIIESSGYLLAGVIKDLRNLARQPSPTAIMQKGFADSISYELERLAATGLVKTDFTIRGKLFRLEEVKELVLFSILQNFILEAACRDKCRYLTVDILYKAKKIFIRISYPAANRISDKSKEAEIRKRSRLVEAVITAHENQNKKIIVIKINK